MQMEADKTLLDDIEAFLERVTSPRSMGYTEEGNVVGRPILPAFALDDARALLERLKKKAARRNDNTEPRREDNATKTSR
jgi:hypothetical protein